MVPHPPKKGEGGTTYRGGQNFFSSPVHKSETVDYGILLAAFAGVAERFGYGLTHGPLFEDLGVFQRLGAGTDVVRKEMYDFEDKGGRKLALTHNLGGAPGEAIRAMRTSPITSDAQ